MLYGQIVGWLGFNYFHYNLVYTAFSALLFIVQLDIFVGSPKFTSRVIEKLITVVCCTFCHRTFFTTLVSNFLSFLHPDSLHDQLDEVGQKKSRLKDGVKTNEMFM